MIQLTPSQIDKQPQSLMPLSQYFRLIDIQARMSLRGEASRYFLGYLWWLLEPLIFVGVFYVVFSIILDTRTENYLVFLMCGKFAFIWFSKTVTIASNSIVLNKGLIAKINVSKTLFPMALVQESLYRQAAVFSLLFAVLLVFGYPVTTAWFWLFPLILVNYLMIVACALIAASLVCVVRDFTKLVPLAMTFLLFTSGIFWDVHGLDDPQKTEIVLVLNPLAFILDAYRQILMYQTSPDASHLSILALLFITVIGATVRLMREGSQYLALKALSA